ncbi:MAG: response regulator [Leptolyngbyaceae cyanobacterium bins.59]|nr:response regulator [Leptolyngbyaceae cyanobacterium bins.59]
MPLLLKSPWDDIVHPLILIIEDSDEDFYALLRTIQQSEMLQQGLSLYRFLRFQDGDEALDYLLREGEYQTLTAPLPSFILLDLNLPGTDGREIIQRVKNSSSMALNTLPIVVLTTSNSPRDIQTCYCYGANTYLLKPMGVSEMRQTVQILFQYWFQLAVLPRDGELTT